MIITSHAKKRMKERCGFSKKVAEEMANKALLYGIPHRALQGAICQWVNKIYLARKHANNIRIYGREAYLFKNTVLLTVIRIPDNCIASLEKSKQRLKDERNSK